MRTIRLVSLAIVSIALSACSFGLDSNAAFESEHNARSALDWAGTYRGVLPCADCEGIATVVTLEDDGTYQTRSEYLGRGGVAFEEKGRFNWNAAGNTVTLGESEPALYFVAENRLIRRAQDGSPITGPLADAYVLEKDPESN